MVQPTPYFSLLYGSLQINGSPAPVGTRVEAITTAGEFVGCMETTSAGVFGLMSVFGADDQLIPGYSEGQEVVLRVNGLQITHVELAWSNDKAPHWLDVSTTFRVMYLPSVTR